MSERTPATPFVERVRGRSAGEAEERSADLDVTVLVVVDERPEPLDELYRTYAPAVADVEPNHEFVFVVQPWNMERVEALRPLHGAGEPIRIIAAHQTLDEASLLKLGAQRRRGEIVITLPAYYRVTPDALPAMVEAVRGGVDVAVARRVRRRDSWINRLQGSIFHFVLRSLVRTHVRDVACGVRALRAGVLQEMALYGDFARFLPVLAESYGYRVEEVAAEQHPGDRRVRVYSPGVYVRRAIDLIGLFFLTRFTYKPLRFFGLVGTAFSAVGGAILLVLFVQRVGGQALANRPMLLLGVLLLTLGVQAIALGLVGEIIVHLNVPAHRSYTVAEESGNAEGRNATETGVDSSAVAGDPESADREPPVPRSAGGAGSG